MNGYTGRTVMKCAARAGQVLLPALLVVPSLLLFVYLIFETAKLSREKIRQQFAVDSAAFIQMGDYTNILNRTAYVNGAFPYRIFKEAYECPDRCSNGTEDNCLKKTDDSPAICTYQMLYEAGAFPKYRQDQPYTRDATDLDNIRRWDMVFDETARSHMNTNPANPEDTFSIITYDQGLHVYIFWDPAVAIYKFYAQVYTLLGTVEESQMTVFERLTENFNFFRKSYYLNANTEECTRNPDMCGEDGIRSTGGFRDSRFVRGSSMAMHYINKIKFHAKVPQSGLPPYFLGNTNPPLQMPSPGLFQLATFSSQAMSRIGNGYNVYQGWSAPSNYFNVDFNRLVPCQQTGRPCVHALVASQCPSLTESWGSSPNNCVWPNPTPKYQTRLYP